MAPSGPSTPTEIRDDQTLENLSIPGAAMEQVRIDIRDLDYRWCEDVELFFERDFDIYYFPRESAERLGELDEESGNYYLTAANVEAEPDEIEFDGQRIPVWSVRVGNLVTRPARSS